MSAIELPARLSYSSLSTYAECGEKWRLTRGYGLDEHTWWATIGGSTVHACIEQEMSNHLGEEVKCESFETLFDFFTAEEKAKGLDIMASGKLQANQTFAGGPDKKDRGWWMHYGPLMVSAYLSWFYDMVEQGWKIVATEHFFEVQIGPETVAGSIDLVMVDGAGNIAIIDVKSGAETPGKLQLATYRDGLLNSTGLFATWGAYLRFDTEKEKITAIGPRGGETVKTLEAGVYAFIAGRIDYADYSPEYVEHQYSMARDGIDRGIFLANTRNNCRSCGVRDYCRAVGGVMAGMYPVVSELLPAKTPDTLVLAPTV